MTRSVVPLGVIAMRERFESFLSLDFDIVVLSPRTNNILGKDTGNYRKCHLGSAEPRKIMKRFLKFSLFRRSMDEPPLYFMCQINFN